MTRFWLIVASVGMFQACAADLEGPAPVLADPAPGLAIPPIDPYLICADQLATTVTVNGGGFSPVPYDVPNAPKTAIPTIVLERTKHVDGTPVDALLMRYDGESDGPNSQWISWRSASEMAFVVNQDLVIDDAPSSRLGQGVYDVRVTNPNGNSATSKGALAAIERPQLSDVTPPIVCLTEGERTLELTGVNFLTTDGAPPQLFIEGSESTLSVANLDGCSDIVHAALEAQLCTGGTVTIPQSSIDVGYPALTIENPGSANCRTEESVNLRVVPPPGITSVEPPAVCVFAGDQTVTVNGDHFLTIDGVTPTVTLDGEPVSVEALGGCEPLETFALTVERCSSLTVVIPQASPAESYQPELAITNPAPAGCSSSTSTLLEIVAPPQVEGVSPGAICSGEGGPLTITGSGFAQNARVWLAGSDGTVVLEADSVTVNSSTSIEANMPGGGTPPGVYDLVVSNAEGCEALLVAAVEVHPTPLVFFIDPPVAYNGVAIQATIYTSGLQAEASDVRLVGPNGEEEVLTGTSPPGKPNRISAVIPAGLTPGSWDIQITSDIGCVGALDDGLTVTDTLSLTLASVDPAYVWTGSDTAITVTAGAASTFVGQPRMYLNPNPSGADTVAAGLRAVLRTDDTTLTAVVPSGLPIGEYDLLVVAPDGAVGLLDKGVTVTQDPPPVVDSVSPGSFDSNAPFPAEIQGENFDSAGVTVTMTCQQPSGVVVEDLAVSVTSVTPATITAIFPSDQVEAGSVCVLTVVNGDGTRFRFSAVSTKTPAQNLNPWTPATPMQEARRALSLTAARPTAASRYVYAVGGDDGAVSNAKTTVEAANVGLFGTMGDWTTLPTSLPAGRTFAGVAQVGQYIYLIGGHDGTAAQDSVWRAQVLDPLDTPEVLDIDVRLLDDRTSGGLSQGVWIYRVAALFPSDDPYNPGGESLPGEPLVVQLPQIDGLELILNWDAIVGASGYRIYRTADANQGVEALELLAEVTGQTTFADAGGSTNGVIPVIPGSLGQWHPVASLNTPREGAAVALVQRPNQPNDRLLYVFGGRDASGAAVDSYEYATLTIAAPGSDKAPEAQTLQAWSPGVGAFGPARADCGAFVVTQRDVAALDVDETWIFVGPGQDANGTVGESQAANVSENGTLAWLTPGKAPTSRAGYGYGDANGFLFMFGGSGGNASSDGSSGQLCIGENLGGCNPDQLPEIRNWNGLGVSMSVNRVFPGTAQESAFFFIAGGSDGSAATTSVDTTVQ